MESKDSIGVEDDDDDDDDDEVGLACLVQGVSLVRGSTSLPRRARVYPNASWMAASVGGGSVLWTVASEPAMAE